MAVIGGGIKGAAVAALLSVHPNLHVTVLEADRLGSGTTSTNHGRLHAGTEHWRDENLELMRRRHRGSVLTRAVAALPADKPARYALPHELSDEFAERCHAASIPIRRHPADAADLWISDPGYDLFDVPEFPFNPARLTGALSATARCRGAAIQTGRRVDEVALRPEAVSLRVDGDGELEVDVTLNLAARWSVTIDVRDRPPLLEIDLFQWRLLCVRADVMPPLDHIVAVSDQTGRTFSGVPHPGWVVIDGGADPKQAETPDLGRMANWRAVDPSMPAGAALLEQATSWLPGLREAAASGSVFTFDGIQGRLRGAKPGSISTLFTYPDDGRYIVSFGGQASTAILDAVELIDHLWARGFLPSGDGAWSLGRLSAWSLAGRALSGEWIAGMIWEEVARGV